MMIREMVQAALLEDVGAGDITAELISSHEQCRAQIITREPMIVCGVDFVNEAFKQVDEKIVVIWQVKETDRIAANTVLFNVEGPARSILTAERTALNFLQLLSGTATTTSRYVEKIKNTQTKLLDTRKTLPLYRQAQKYAVKCGGGENHRMGLYDMFLIKENHITACGSITKAIETARLLHSDKKVEVEVENLTEYQEALNAKPDIIMLDNFSMENIKTAVAQKNKNIKLEVSGNVSLENIANYAALGVDYISVGAITKHVNSIDLSLRIIATAN
ncbi:MAG: carboxylating nicotinate-nucleotide diphosphorylase [Pseudomonadota bacterium]